MGGDQQRRRGRSLLAVNFTVSNQTVDLVYGVMNATNLADTSQVRTTRPRWRL